MPLDISRAGAIVLAAGASVRMGRAKQLLPLADGRPLLTATIQGLLDAGLPRVIAVLGCRAEQVAGACPEDSRVTVALNPDWEQGMFTSVQAGVRALLAFPELEAFFLQPGDNPHISRLVIKALLAAYDPAGPDIVTPICGGRGGHPALISLAYGPELLSGELPQGLKSLFAANSGRLLRLAVEEAGVLTDVDTPEDYRRLL